MLLCLVRSSIHVVTCALPELPIFVNVWNVGVAGAGVRENTGYPVPFSVRAETCLNWYVLVSGCEAA
jgi:hypothetical protein